MFYYKTDLVRRVRIHPSAIKPGTDPKKIAKSMLRQDLRTTPFLPEVGYIVDVICINSVGDGYCLPFSGFIEFGVSFEATVLYPVIGEVVNAVVEKVTPSRIVFNHVGIYGVVRDYGLNHGDQFKYEEREVMLMSKEGTEKKSVEGIFRSEINSSKVLQKGTCVRVKLTERSLEGNGFFLAGTMASEFLGPLKNQDALAHARLNESLSLVKSEIVENMPGDLSESLSHGELEAEETTSGILSGSLVNFKLDVEETTPGDLSGSLVNVKLEFEETTPGDLSELLSNGEQEVEETAVRRLSQSSEEDIQSAVSGSSSDGSSDLDELMNKIFKKRDTPSNALECLGSIYSDSDLDSD